MRQKQLVAAAGTAAVVAAVMTTAVAMAVPLAAATARATSRLEALFLSGGGAPRQLLVQRHDDVHHRRDVVVPMVPVKKNIYIKKNTEKIKMIKMIKIMKIITITIISIIT